MLVGHELKNRIDHLPLLMLPSLSLCRGGCNEGIYRADVSTVRVTSVVAWQVPRHGNSYHQHLRITTLAVFGLVLPGNCCTIVSQAWYKQIAGRDATTHPHRHLPKVCNDIPVNCLIWPWE
jgi:hypothetical protein